MRKKIRILFVNCPTLSADAAAFLLLAQNGHQDIFQFEVQHYWICGRSIYGPDPRRNPLRSKLIDFMWRFDFYARRKSAKLDLSVATRLRQKIKLSEWFECAESVIRSYDDWFSSSGYNNYDWSKIPTIIITETPFEYGYMSFADKGIGVLSLASWKEYFAPGSALEFLLAGVQRLSLRLIYGDAIGSHFSTRGCIWDFSVYQRDSKISAGLGILCDTCKKSLLNAAGNRDIVQIEKLIGNKWIGSRDDPSSVCATIEKIYGYNLKRSNGLHPNLLSSISESMKSEVGRFIYDILKWVIILLLTLFIATKFPGVFRIIKQATTTIGGESHSSWAVAPREFRS